ncbi:uncharacterized protein N7458_000576 [Penicillium daleae]|uniref:DUF7779 domain-containing protein n=1 Tax=Penicillium daleae TaxID=63821 RepID=A0AAD6G7Y7_9EURO|nr:uncharacterized protein N7458_000576 [Penicillium daleae]KAJ5464890.1 hypothetical protein N7458_000576 [Penicillium daleae]
MTQGERSEPRPEPLSTVPFPRDPDFVGRNGLLDQIHEKASIAGSRLALVGLGGVGLEQHVHASNVARCEKSLRDLADRAKIPGSQDRNANIFQVVGHWLQDGKIGKWILVLDNVDDDELLRKSSAVGTDGQINTHSGTSTQPLLRYLFDSFNGSIIVTSRNRAVALNVASHKNIIELQPMNQTEGLDLLQKKLSIPTEQEIIVRLARELEFMPLAIVQAAGYITHRSPRCSVSQYLEKIQKGDREAARVLNDEAGLLYRDWEAKNSILLTWQISFDYIRWKRPSATDLLSLMSFFNWQGITEDVLRVDQNQKRGRHFTLEQLEDSLSEQDTDNESNGAANTDFDKDITILCDFSLIAVGEDSMSFTMHRLVQLTVRTWLKAHGQLEYWKGLFIKNLSLLGAENEEALDSTTMLAGAYRLVGRWEEAEQLYLQVLETCKTKLSADHPSTLSSMANLASTYRNQGRWDEAEQLEVQVLETRRTKLGKDHPSTLTSMANLASTYRNQGRWDEAEQLLMHVLETRKIKFGADHPDTLTSMANLASTYRDQGRWDEAEQIDLQVLKTCRTKLGADHPDTLTSMANLASTYRNQGRWDEAEQLEVQALETRRTKLGKDHPSTLTSMANLASTYRNQGRWDKAEQLDMQALETRRTTLGADHPDTLTSMANLASTYRNQGQWDEAEQLLVQVLEISKTKLGADHPDTLKIMANLASSFWYQGRWEKTEQLLVQVLEICRTKLGVDHSSTLTSMANLASTYRKQGRWDEAEQLEVQVLETSKSKLGADHPDTLTSMANLASTFEATGRRPAAIDLLRSCVTKQQRILGPAHPETVSNSDILLAWEAGEVTIEN